MDLDVDYNGNVQSFKAFESVLLYKAAKYWTKNVWIGKNI